MVPNAIEQLRMHPDPENAIIDYEQLNCKEIALSPVKIAVPERCKHYHYGISVFINEGAKGRMRISFYVMIMKFLLLVILGL